MPLGEHGSIGPELPTPAPLSGQDRPWWAFVSRRTCVGYLTYSSVHRNRAAFPGPIAHDLVRRRPRYARPSSGVEQRTDHAAGQGTDQHTIGSA